MSIHEIFGQTVAELDDLTLDIATIATLPAGEILIQPVFSNQGTGNFVVLMDSDGTAFRVESSALYENYDLFRSNGESALLMPKQSHTVTSTETLLSTVANHVAGASENRNVAIAVIAKHLTDTERLMLPTIRERGQAADGRGDLHSNGTSTVRMQRAA